MTLSTASSCMLSTCRKIFNFWNNKLLNMKKQDIGLWRGDVIASKDSSDSPRDIGETPSIQHNWRSWNSLIWFTFFSNIMARIMSRVWF